MTKYINVNEGSVSEVFQAFFDSGVHGRHWPNSTYAVAMYTLIDGSKRVIAKNEDGGSHVEKLIIEHFKTLLETRILHIPKFKMFLSFSPCDKCCRRIIKFLSDDGLNLKAEIVFSSLYYVKRDSCAPPAECSCHDFSDEVHERNVAGLKDLFSHPRVDLRTIGGQDWLDLATALDFQVRTEQDNRLREDFKAIMPSVQD